MRLIYVDNGFAYYQIEESDDPDATFKSSVEEFTTYYRVTGFYDIQERLAHMYVVMRNQQVIGYVTLAMQHLRYDATEEIKEKRVKYNIPALLISHLAVHEDFQRRGIGTKLLDLVFYLAPKLTCWVGCRYAMLSPRHSKGVMAFYENYGFKHPPNFNDNKYSDVFLMDLKEYYSQVDVVQ